MRRPEVAVTSIEAGRRRRAAMARGNGWYDDSGI
jgi:hypothetical protein